MVKSGKYDFIKGSQSYRIDNIGQHSKLSSSVIENIIRWNRLSELKYNLIIVKK